jgi:putative transposase
MQAVYNKGFRSVYSLTAHTVFVTKYRKKVINHDSLVRLDSIFHLTCQKWDSKLEEFNGECDHVHLLISYPPQLTLTQIDS